MKIRHLFLAATALVALASCTSDTFTGTEDDARLANGDQAITFGFDVSYATRADGAAAATKLNRQFIVYGEKNETDKTAPAAGNLVFPNYKVTYGANTAYTTTSNTKDWEYVGLAYGDEKANIKMATVAATNDVQTIKFWDYAATSYTFTAVSAKPEDIAAGRVIINKLTSDDDSKYKKGYTITLAKTAGSPDVYPNLADLYFSDRNEIAHGTGKDRTAKDAYGGNVTFQFRNSLTQVRAGVYETIPGYKVTAIKFYVTGNTEAKVSETSAFGVIAPNIKPDTYEGTLTVTYYDDTDADTKNHPKLSFTGTPATDLVLGTNMSLLSPSAPLGTTSTAPTWDKNGGEFTSVLPQIDNTTDMQLKVDYTLYNEVTHETINITGKTAEVPAKYLAWKPNFRYTYLFKITDDDLYPITFDAVVVEAEEGEAEYITTINDISITTFGVKGGKYSVGKNEYEAGTDVYATIFDGSAVIDPDGKYNVYTVTTTDADLYPITEASVAESLAEVSAQSHEVTCTPYAGTKSLETTVPGEDGNDITLTAGKAIKLNALAAGTYAIEYVKTARTLGYQEVTYATSDEFTAALAAVNLYSNSGCTTPAEAGDYVDATTKFYKKVVTNVGVYSYKVIKVTAAP